MVDSPSDHRIIAPPIDYDMTAKLCDHVGDCGHQAPPVAYDPTLGEAHYLKPAPQWVADLATEPWKAEITRTWGSIYQIRLHGGGMEEIPGRMTWLGHRRALAIARRALRRKNSDPRRWTIRDDPA